MKDVTWPLGVDAALALANTMHGPGSHYRRRASMDEPAHDHLDTAERAIEFLGSHDVPLPGGDPSGADLARLRDIRTAARSLLGLPTSETPGWTAAITRRLDGTTFRFDAEARLHAAAPGWPGLADELVTAVLALAHERERLTSCGNPLCGWLFVDRSRNRSRVWCEMAVCGNRVKVGRHRRAARRDAPTDRGGRTGSCRAPSGGP